MQQVSQRIRKLRREKGLSLRNLANQSGVSASALSQIESEQVSPSIATLEKICAALSLPITALFDEQNNVADPQIMPANNRRKVYSATSHASVEPLSRGLSKKKMQPILVTLDPGGEVGEHPYSAQEGEEFAIIIQGSVQFEQNGKTYELHEKDAVYFDPHQPHNWKNGGTMPSMLLIVVSS
jgi:transcriptional regulator with XRE-family HTH domain